MIKDKLYNFFVRENGRVWYEYERYVREHMEEHRLHRFRHLRVLLKLNWFYRVKKGNTPYMYWDTPIKPQSDCKKKEDAPSKVQKDICKKKEDAPSKVQKDICKKKEDTSSKAQKDICKKKEDTKNTTREKSADGNLSEYFIEKRVTAYSFAMGLKAYDVISFDVFDTLIFRKFVEPEHVFMLIGQKFGIYDFISIRKRAEKEVRDEHKVLFGHRECTLEEIYDRVAFYTGIDKREGIETEILYEMKCCIENPYIKQVYQILKGMKKRIFVTSNMYLGKEIIRKILENCGYDYFEDILVSCDYNCSKTSGHLFEILIKKVAPASVVHIGDNVLTDIKGAKLVNLDAKYYESVASKGNKYRARGFSSLIGTAYYSLINRKLHSGVLPCLEYSLYWEFGYVYGGLIGLGYVNWIHEKAQATKADKIIFLARDGALLKEIYDSLFQDIPAEYMLWSRIAGIRNITVGNVSEVMLRCIEENVNSKLSIRDVIEMLGWDNCLHLFKKVMPIAEMTLNEENYKYIQKIISENWEIIMKNQKEEYEYIEQYVSSKVIGSQKIMLVDLGWTGKNDNKLKEIMLKLYPNLQVNICMMGSLVKTQDAFGIKNKSFECYMFASDFNREIHDAFCKNWKLLDCMEKIFSSSACSFCGFSKDGKYEFANPEIENFDMCREIASGVLDFCKDYVEDYAELDPALMNISGYDAYVSFRNILKRNDIYRTLFSGTVYTKGISTIHSKI